MKIVDVETVRAWIGDKASPADPVLDRLIESASTHIVQLLNQPVLAQTWSERYDGGGTDALVLRYGPVSSITSVAIDGVAVPNATGYGDSGWWRDPGSPKLRLSQRRFTLGKGNVAVTYRAGYEADAVPLDIVQAVCELVALRNAERDRVGFTSKSLAGETVSFLMRDLAPSTLAALQPYRRIVP